MTVRVRTSSEGYAIDGPWEGCAAANAFLVHLVGRGFSAATVRAYGVSPLGWWGFGSAAGRAGLCPVCR